MLIVPAAAKLNLALEVLARRADGFHDIDSVIVPLDWHDLVGVEIRGDARVTLRVSGASAGLDDPSNLALRAAQALGAAAGVGVAVWLDKRLPMAAGLGGGSADAAATLRAGARLLGERIDVAQLAEIAAGLGSDVPALLAGGAARIRGRGEIVEPLAAPPLWFALAVAGESATAPTYAAVSEFSAGDRVGAVIAALGQGTRPGEELLGSALEAPAVRAHPALGEALERLRHGVARARWHLTGSGGCAFALASGPGEAQALAGQAAGLGFLARVCRSAHG